MSRVGCGIELGQPRRDARQRFGKVVEAAARGTELVAVFVVVLLLPARADAEDQPCHSEMWSTVRAMSASNSGLRYELHDTSAPISMRDVCSAQAPNIVQHS